MGDIRHPPTREFTDRVIVRHFATTALIGNINNLALLEWFDEREPRLFGHTSAVFGTAAQAHNIAERLAERALMLEQPIDPDQVVVRTLTSALSTAMMVKDVLQARSDRIASNTALTPDAAALAIDECAEAIDAQMTLVDALNRLRGEVERHDADLNVLTGPFPQVQDVLATIMR